MLIAQDNHNLDLTAGESDVTSVRIDVSRGTDLSIWCAPTSASDPSTAACEAFDCITAELPAEAIERLTAAGTVDLTGASILDLDVSKRSHVFVKITTPEADRSVQLFYALWDNRSV